MGELEDAQDQLPVLIRLVVFSFRMEMLFLERFLLLHPSWRSTSSSTSHGYNLYGSNNNILSFFFSILIFAIFMDDD